jgi:hypothetical protein
MRFRSKNSFNAGAVVFPFSDTKTGHLQIDIGNNPGT